MHSIAKIANYINAVDVVGDSDLLIKGLCGIDSGQDGYISYIHEKQYVKYLNITKASAVIVGHKCLDKSNGKTLIGVDATNFLSFNSLLV